MTGPQTPEAALDLRERGAPKDGQPSTLDTRLFMQLLVYQVTRGTEVAHVRGKLTQLLQDGGHPAVLYRDFNHPRGLAVLSWSQEPNDFVQRLHPRLAEVEELELRPELTQVGRSYSSGFEPDLSFWLLERPVATVSNPNWRWAVWYPLRRTGAFEQLPAADRGRILHEHAAIGRSYGTSDLVHDVRLACHGLDANDNEFVLGLVGKELYPLSHVVQAMRKTQQTSQYIAHMGPFFVGYAEWQAPR